MVLWYVMFVVSAPLTCYKIYNLIVALGMKNPDPYLIDGTLTMSNNTWSKLAMIGTWLGDSTTL